MQVRSLLTGAIGALLVATSIGCGGGAQEQTTPKQDDSSAAAGELNGATTEPVAFTNANGEIVCPVMGTVIASKDKAVGHQDYEGKRYYFCCGECPEVFAKDPAKYKDGKPAEDAGTDAADGHEGHEHSEGDTH